MSERKQSREPLLAEDWVEAEDADPAREHTNILVAVDGTEASEHAVQKAFTRYHRDGDEMHLAFVMERKIFADMHPADVERKKAMICQKAHLLTEKYDEEFKKHNIAGTLHFVQAWDAVEGILAVINRKNIDLLVVGTRGHGKIKSMILGSTSKTLSAHAPCAVLIVR